MVTVEVTVVVVIVLVVAVFVCVHTTGICHHTNSVVDGAGVLLESRSSRLVRYIMTVAGGALNVLVIVVVVVDARRSAFEVELVLSRLWNARKVRKPTRMARTLCKIWRNSRELESLKRVSTGGCGCGAIWPSWYSGLGVRIEVILAAEVPVIVGIEEERSGEGRHWLEVGQFGRSRSEIQFPSIGEVDRILG